MESGPAPGGFPQPRRSVAGALRDDDGVAGRGLAVGEVNPRAKPGWVQPALTAADPRSARHPGVWSSHMKRLFVSTLALCLAATSGLASAQTSRTVPSYGQDANVRYDYARGIPVGPVF